MTPEYQVRLWRDRLLKVLQERGTQTACEAIASLHRQYPQYSWLQEALLEAQEKEQENSWNPPLPGDLIAMARHPSRRHVGSGTELLDLVCESLAHLEHQLHGITPARVDLWNKSLDGACHPIDEPDFADYVKRFLDRNLRPDLVVNREVQIRRRAHRDGEQGQQPDILVTATEKHPHPLREPRLTLSVEVKGCWHREVRSALQTQLVGRYLNRNPSPFGLYLVAWFSCDAWDKQDERRSRVPWGSIEDARIELATEALFLTKSLPPPGEVRCYVLDCRLS